MSSNQNTQNICLGGAMPTTAIAISSAPVASVSGGRAILPVNRLNRIFGRSGWQIRCEVNYTHSSASQLLTQITSRADTGSIEVSATKTTDIPDAGVHGRTITHIWVPTALTRALDCDATCCSLTLEAGKGTTAVGNPSVREWQFTAEALGEPA